MLSEVFAQRPQIEKVILYGSRVKGTYKPFSDIDITLVGNEEIINSIVSIYRLYAISNSENFLKSITNAEKLD